MRSITAITLFLFTVLGATASHATYTWTTLDPPGSTSTTLYDIDGANMVGSYTDSSGNAHGFLYNGYTWVTLDKPGATSTTLYDIDGANMVGVFSVGVWSQGFMVTATFPVPEPAAILLALFGVALLP